MNVLTYVAGWTLLHFAWQGSLIALEAAVALRLLRRAAAQTRYVVACVALVAMAASPVVTARMLSRPVGTESSVAMIRRVPLRASTFTVPVPPGSRVRLSRRDVFIARATPSRLDALLPFVVSLWLVGAVALLLRLAGGWWRVHRLYQGSLIAAASRWQNASDRMAARLGLSRDVHVVDSSLIDTPVVFGWLRPVVLLPVASVTQLSPAQVQAILAHELAHVRRHDYIVNVLQTVVETLLFYHPAVWWVSARIRAEREHCCDDVAVQACGDAIGYAEALTELDRWRAGHTTLALAATGGSLLARIKHVLRAPAEAAPHTSNSAMAIGLALLLILAGGASQWLPTALAAQTRASVGHVRVLALGPREVNGILGYELFPEPRDPHDDPRGAVAWRINIVDQPSGRMDFHGFTGRGLIRFAYDLPDARILGGPSWIDTESVDLSATMGTIPDAFDDPTWRSVIHQALEERLQLTTHHETREIPVYALVRIGASTLGPNLRPSTSACVDPMTLRDTPVSGTPLVDPSLHEQSMRFCGHGENGMTGMTFERVTMADLARELSHPGPLLDREVVDRTGLPGAFDLNLDLGFMPAAAVMSRHPDLASWFQPLGFRSIFTAVQEQLGLRLEESTAPDDVLVIDHAVRPTP
jgi:uncharacterized protein (TIGR03435 family)